MVMREPVFEPAPGVDLTDVDLPTHCECGAFLPHASKWEVEVVPPIYDEGEELVAYVACTKCEHMNTMKVAER